MCAVILRPKGVPLPHLAQTDTLTDVRKVLIVEDDMSLAIALREGFVTEGYDVSSAADGVRALERARQVQPDLMILDVMLPKISGLDVCRMLRSEGCDVPIIMLTARGLEIDKVLGLKLGADDYVTKPFSLLELLARAESVMRRRSPRFEAAPPKQSAFMFGPIKVDLARHEVKRNGMAIKMTSREFMLLRYFIENRGRVVTRDELLNDVWGYQALPFTRTVDTHVAKLRKKIEDDPHDPRYLITVHRLGYKFTA
ncbi:MAG: response regulator transcription factor [Acidobacteria bacterium]|nr:response regulator transcription factor [Acidobacteriota bacterium]